MWLTKLLITLSLPFSVLKSSTNVKFLPIRFKSSIDFVCIVFIFVVIFAENSQKISLTTGNNLSLIFVPFKSIFHSSSSLTQLIG